MQILVGKWVCVRVYVHVLTMSMCVKAHIKVNSKFMHMPVFILCACLN